MWLLIYIGGENTWNIFFPKLRPQCKPSSRAQAPSRPVRSQETKTQQQRCLKTKVIEDQRETGVATEDKSAETVADNGATSQQLRHWTELDCDDKVDAAAADVTASLRATRTLEGVSMWISAVTSGSASTSSGLDNEQRNVLWRWLSSRHCTDPPTIKAVRNALRQDYQTIVVVPIDSSERRETAVERTWLWGGCTVVSVVHVECVLSTGEWALTGGCKIQRQDKHPAAASVQHEGDTDARTINCNSKVLSPYIYTLAHCFVDRWYAHAIIIAAESGVAIQWKRRITKNWKLFFTNRPSQTEHAFL